MMDLQSLGDAAAMYQRDPRELAAALAVVQAQTAAALGGPVSTRAVPMLVLNGVPYFKSSDVAEAAAWLARHDAAAERGAGPDA
jgi:hypothetical protein